MTKHILIKKLDCTAANAHSAGREFVNVFPVEKVVLELLLGNEIRRFLVELGEQSYFTDIGLLSPFFVAIELKCCDHLGA